MFWRFFLPFLSIISINSMDACFTFDPLVTTNFCNGTGNVVHVGDFDGNGKDDFVCHNSVTGDNVIYYAPRRAFLPTKYTSIRWCNGVNSRFYVGDFNGDGRSDFLCHTTNVGYKWVALANSNGEVTGTNWEAAMGWCHHTGAELFTGDFNGDGRTDILCHDTSGNMWISYADGNGRFSGTSWHKSNFPRCNGRLLTGDFNGDQKTDIMCHDTASVSLKRVSFAGNSTNVFSNYNWSGQKGWCKHNGAFLIAGDINGDGRDDLICKDTGVEGNTWYSKNSGSIQNLFGPTTIHITFCRNSSRSGLHLADVDANGKKDLLCVTKLGFVQVARSVSL